MKVAVCISGQPRNYKKGFLELKKWFLDKYDCDVYIHTWYDTKAIFETGHDYLEKKTYSFTHKDYSNILKLYKPKAYEFQKPIVFDGTGIVGTHCNYRLDNLLSAAYSIHTCYNLVKESGIEYDLNRYTYHKALNLFRNELGKPGITISEKYNKDTILGFARGIPVNMTYTLTAWTMYREDMNQIIEQIMTKFSQVAYITVTGVQWEVIVKLDSIANNLNNEPGDQQIRVIKYEFNMTAQTYIPQPIERKKAVLKMKIDFVDGLKEEEITEVLMRIEQSVKELEC